MRLHDYLTGVSDQHEPRVRLLFEMVQDGTLDLSGDLADVPATCFFLGDRVRYQASLADWCRVFGRPRRYDVASADPAEVELWGVGDLLWRADRAAAEASREFLTLAADRAVPLLRAVVPLSEFRVLAVDAWSGRVARRVVVAPADLTAEVVTPGDDLPFDVPILPAPRIAAA